MTPSQIIVLATPVFFTMIAVEFAWGVHKKRNTYRFADAINSISLGMMSQFTAIFTRLLRVGIYTFVYVHVSLVPLDAAKAFWQSWYGWVLALIFYDLCYYWQHRLGHESAIFWAAHAVHHQSQDYNLSTALRQTSSGALLSWLFYIPMAVAGVPPLVFGIVALIDLLYQFWVHTEHVGKLGWFDRWFCSPSNHRVHHAVNDQYLDKNYGGVLVVWDRIFGSYQDEAQPCVYGTRSALNSWDPLWANFEVYAAIFQDAWHARGLDKLRVFVKPPGWRPAYLAAQFPKPAFDIARPTGKFEAPASRAARLLGGIGFLVLLNLVGLFLWFADGLSTGQQLAGVAGLAAALWVTGALLQGRLHSWLALAGFAAVLATVSAVFAASVAAPQAEVWTVVHRATKPLVMLFAIIFVAACAYFTSTSGKIGRHKLLAKPLILLLAAMALSMAGDTFLMFNGFFIPGLVAFLLAHLCYIARFKQDAPWFASKVVLLAMLAYGAAMCAWLWPFLAQGLRAPVVAYIAVIALMGAQAVGRALHQRDAASRWVAVGALLFMLSDSMLAINKFVTPVPLSPLWILSSYFVAQLLIAANSSTTQIVKSE